MATTNTRILGHGQRSNLECCPIEKVADVEERRKKASAYRDERPLAEETGASSKSERKEEKRTSPLHV